MDKDGSQLTCLGVRFKIVWHYEKPLTDHSDLKSSPCYLFFIMITQSPSDIETLRAQDSHSAAIHVLSAWQEP